MKLFSSFKGKLGKPRTNIVGRLAAVVTGQKQLDDKLLTEVEATLIQADLGVDTSLQIVEQLRERVKKNGLTSPTELPGLIRDLLLEMISPQPEEVAGSDLTIAPVHVILVVGVNGTGKTTTIGKLMKFYRDAGYSVLVGAADTFRAAATEQLAVWCERNDVPLIKSQSGADPAAVAFDTVTAALARGSQVVIIDTAGRLHTRKNLMQELEKIHRVIGKRIPGAPHEVLLVLDATTGQNALTQAGMFAAAAGVTGLVLAKLDGTARGGIAIAIHKEMQIPVRFVGLGEGIDDLAPFDPQEYVKAIFED
ncbi:MAG: signal recognition particle-docking protein FtsY [Candidatus Delongbacteria bacterium]|nr:signal recognition particle-docking protein FtsY [Candidatus Delongbacteria bacterium]